jgi:4-hydroxy-3-polyprenylbenzoate decarboxylase
MKNITVAVTGASGARYAVRLLQALADAGCRVHLTISEAGAKVLKHETGIEVDLDNFSVAEFSEAALAGRAGARIEYHRFDDIAAPIASGTYPIDAMAVVPCSMSTLAGIASGLANNLILRAADVTLKEQRKLVLVPRETPIGTIALENMLRASRAGACILPAMPAFYHGPEKMEDLVDFVVGKVLDQLDVQHDLLRRWEGEK